MSKNAGLPQFESAMRGYERSDVDAAVSALVNERLALEKRAEDLERELVALQEAAANNSRAASYLALCRHLEGVLLGADAEARAATEAAEAAARQEREAVAATAEAERVRGEEYEAARLARAQEAAEKLLGDARAEAERIREEGIRKAEENAAGAHELIDKARADSVVMATEYETTSAAERERFEREVLERQTAADEDLAEATRMYEAAKAQSEALPQDLERAVAVLIGAARGAAAELIAQATARAASLRHEAERELTALTARRDSIHAQLSTGRGNFSTLAGDAAATNDGPAAAEAAASAEAATDAPEAEAAADAPDVAEADQAEPAQAEAAQAETAQAETARPEPAQAEAAPTEPAQPEAQPEAAQPVAAQPEPTQPEPTQPEAPAASVPPPARGRFGRLHSGSKPSSDARK